MLPNEEFALACRAYYEEQGLIVDKTNGEFAHCPYPKSMGDTGYYLLHEHHQHQGLLQSKDVGRCCFWIPDTKRWLLTADYFPDNFFELWDIYDEFCGTAGHTPEAKAKRMETRRRNGNFHLMPQCHTPEANQKRRETFEKRGVFWGHLHTPEMRKKAMETRHRNGTTHMGQCHTQEAIQKSAKARQKQTEIVFPSGRVAVFPSAKFAAAYLGVPQLQVARWARGFSIPSGEFVSYSFRYL